MHSTFKILEVIFVGATSPYGASPPVTIADETRKNFDLMALCTYQREKNKKVNLASFSFEPKGWWVAKEREKARFECESKKKGA